MQVDRINYNTLRSNVSFGVTPTRMIEDLSLLRPGVRGRGVNICTARFNLAKTVEKQVTNLFGHMELRDQNILPQLNLVGETSLPEGLSARCRPLAATLLDLLRKPFSCDAMDDTCSSLSNGQMMASIFNGLKSPKPTVIELNNL